MELAFFFLPCFKLFHSVGQSEGRWWLVYLEPSRQFERFSGQLVKLKTEIQNTVSIIVKVFIGGTTTEKKIGIRTFVVKKHITSLISSLSV